MERIFCCIITAYGHNSARFTFYDKEGILESSELAKNVVDAVLERKGFDIIMLDMRDVSFIADYFVICSGNVDRQVDAIVEEVVKQLKKRDVLPHHVEGTPESGWMLVDYGSVVAHVFVPEEREYYALERLWNKAKTVVRIQ